MNDFYLVWSCDPERLWGLERPETRGVGQRSSITYGWRLSGECLPKQIWTEVGRNVGVWRRGKNTDVHSICTLKFFIRYLRFLCIRKQNEAWPYENAQSLCIPIAFSNHNLCFYPSLRPLYRAQLLTHCNHSLYLFVELKLRVFKKSILKLATRCPHSSKRWLLYGPLHRLFFSFALIYSEDANQVRFNEIFSNLLLKCYASNLICIQCSE